MAGCGTRDACWDGVDWLACIMLDWLKAALVPPAAGASGNTNR